MDTETRKRLLLITLIISFVVVFLDISGVRYSIVGQVVSFNTTGTTDEGQGRGAEIIVSEAPERSREGMAMVPRVVAILKSGAIGMRTGIYEIHITVRETAEGVKVILFNHEVWPETVAPPQNRIVYKRNQIKTENLEESLETAVLKIEVERAWLSENLFEYDDVIASRYDETLGVWEDMITEYTHEDGAYYYYDAEYDALEGFILVGGDIQKETPVETVEKSVQRFIKQNDELIFIASMSIAIFLILLIISLKTILKDAKREDFARLY